MIKGEDLLDVKGRSRKTMKPARRLGIFFSAY